MKNLVLLAAVCLSLNAFSQVTVTPFDLNPASTAGSNPGNFCVCNGKLYFSATDGTHGLELWSTDGTSTPTMVNDLNSGNKDAIAVYGNNIMCALNGNLYFAADNGATGTELFMYNGTGAPTLVKDLEPGITPSTPEYLVALNSKLYFSATTAANGKELWVYDPAANTATRLSDVAAGTTSGQVQNLTVFNGKIYFSAGTTTTDRELYVLDPATNNVTLVADIEPGAMGSSPGSMLAYGGKLYFTASTAAYGAEIYSYDGTAAPVRLTDIHSGPSGSVFSTGAAIVGMYNKLYFSATTDGINFRLYQIDASTGTPSLVTAVTETNPGSLIQYGYRLYYRGSESVAGMEPHAFDGTQTALIKDIYPGTTGSYMSQPILFNNALYFAATDDTHGNELFKISDPLAGIAATPQRSFTVYPSPFKNEVHVSMNLQYPAMLTVVLCDVTGREVFHSDANSYPAGSVQYVIPAAKLPSGTYILRIIGTNEAAASYKLIKE